MCISTIVVAVIMVCNNGNTKNSEISTYEYSWIESKHNSFGKEFGTYVEEIMKDNKITKRELRKLIQILCDIQNERKNEVQDSIKQYRASQWL